MSSIELYQKNARVWVPHPETVWESAIVLDDYKENDKILHVQTESGKKIEIKLKSAADLPHLRNPAILIGQNDLTALSYLHEPDVLHNLEVRFCERQAIYTYCGIVLVAINPYSELPLYGADIIRAYRGHSMGELEPHIFAVSEEAYAKLEREKSDISIIVSGESGAGKTVSAKYAMRYFAAVGGSESETQIEKKVLASSPIMEAIGNAKTTRNDNSSRFGKFTKLLFQNKHATMSLTGGTMQTYLLEKSRVVFQAPGERNYHIFYQLCAAREKWPELMLDHQNSFHYLNQGASPFVNKVSDLEQFAETYSAFQTLGFDENEIKEILRILAAVLHLGNIQIQKTDNDGCKIPNDDLNLNVFCELLNLNCEDLRRWLTTRQIESFNETVLIPMNKSSAEAARDALAKHMYAEQFTQIVHKINKNLGTSKKENSFIGVLDIYGFETFDINSFEQFCINYANEKLQQQFNQHVFKLEQEQYLKEGIEWTMIDFYDNQPCIDLIETKLGILDLLDEECRMPKGSDESWVGKLFEKCLKYKHFEKPRFGTTSFLIKHFSDTVQYESYGFLEKNRDTVSRELVNVLKESTMKACRKLMANEDLNSSGDHKTSPGTKLVISAAKNALTPDKRKRPMTQKQQRKTVGSQFRESLTLLITTLHNTTPHYVRCIKPNEDKAAFKWEAPKIVQQLRACGVLETVRISAAGFPSRWNYDDFYKRYRLLCKRVQIVEWNEKATCKNIVRNWLQDEDKYRLGNTQIFFRAGQVAYLEQLRSDTRKKHIILIQSLIRKFICQRKYNRLKRTALGIQCRARGMMARERADKLRKTKAAITIQRYVRGYLQRNKYLQIKKSTLLLQTQIRGCISRQKFKIVLDNHRATQIQRFVRGYLGKQKAKKRYNDIVKCQATVRRFLARRQYKKLKEEARTVAHIQKLYKGLENKIIELQQKIDGISKENQILKKQNAEIPELKRKLDTMKKLEVELRGLQVQLVDKDKSLVQTIRQLEEERDDKMILLEEKQKDEEEQAKEKQTMMHEMEIMRVKLNEIDAANRVDTSPRARLLSEADSDEIYHAYQKATRDKEALENEIFMLRNELKRLTNVMNHPNDLRTHSRSVSNASSQNEEDFGYNSGKNTLEIKKSYEENSSTPYNVENTTPTKDQTSIILKMRKICEDEKSKNEYLAKEIARLRKSSSFNTEDSLKMSELEVENEKLRQDYQLLRNSIKRGVEQQELEAQYQSLLEELKRRRDEIISLKAVLAQQSQSLRSLSQIQNTFNGDMSIRLQDEAELMEAFQAQKLVNRQLESELRSMTDANNETLGEYKRIIDEVQKENQSLQGILLEKVENGEENSVVTLKQSEHYLRHELQKSTFMYVGMQEQINELMQKNQELVKKNNILANRLRDHGLNDSILLNDEFQSMVAVKKKEVSYQGILKYRHEDEAKILQKLVIDMKPRLAITLQPGLPAYVVFMLIRYTDLINADHQVRSLLTKYVQTIKRMYKLPHNCDCRILWLVNTLRLHTMLKQFGGYPEFMKFNTDMQNQQQLKNFDLSEYRLVILDTIIASHTVLVRQVQDAIRPYIVPAILDHDETARGKSNRTKALSLDVTSPEANRSISEPKALVQQLDTIFNQLVNFGLELCYIEQTVKQLMYYICAISLNNLMVRGDMCVWKTGMKMRYNISCLESWVRDKKLDPDVLHPLLPLIQVSLLLQSRKTEVDVATLLELTTALSMAQVMKIIKSYSNDDCEDPIKPAFIEKLQKHLGERSDQYHPENDSYMMNEEDVMALKVVFKPSEVNLEEIEVPDDLHLDGLISKI